jgi:CRISPR-associated protein Cas5d
MSHDYPPLAVRVWGDFACFTRPEMKVERVTYPVPTPSAARGILEAIFWKPEFKWRVEEIWVLNPVNYFSILRNEVNSKASHRSVAGWEKQNGSYVATADRAQRHTLALKDVAYLIQARVELEPHANDPPAKYRDQFRRRVQAGRCFSRPYLGCREFAARFAEPTGNEQPIAHTMSLGRILYDLDYQSDGRGTPLFFTAELVNGILHVPPKPGGEA